MDDQPPTPPIAIRRWQDACFHLVDEVVPEGYILGSVLIPHEDVLETRTLSLDDEGNPIVPACKPNVRILQLPPRPDPKD